MSTILLKYFFFLLKWQPIGQQALDGDVQCVELVHLADSPCPLVSVPAHEAPLMAVVAKRHGGVLLALVDVVGGARWRGIADTAGQTLNPCQMLTLRCVKFIIHRETYLAACALHRKQSQ